jgi:hypothetical protein
MSAFKSENLVPPEKINNKALLTLIQEYVVPFDRTKDIYVPARRVPECTDTMIPRMIKRVNKLNRTTKVNQKIVSECAISLGWAKFCAVPDFHDLIENREDMALHCGSKEEKRAVKRRGAGRVLDRLLPEDEGGQFNLYMSESAHNWITLNASLLRMSAYEVAVYFLCVGLLYGVDESKYDESMKTPAWELKEMDDIIQECNVHIKMIKREHENVMYKLSIINERVF